MSPAQRAYGACGRCGQLKPGEMPANDSAEFLCDDCRKLTGAKTGRSPSSTKRVADPKGSAGAKKAAAAKSAAGKTSPAGKKASTAKRSASAARTAKARSKRR